MAQLVERMIQVADGGRRQVHHPLFGRRLHAARLQL